MTNENEKIYVLELLFSELREQIDSIEECLTQKIDNLRIENDKKLEELKKMIYVFKNIAVNDTFVKIEKKMDDDDFKPLSLFN